MIDNPRNAGELVITTRLRRILVAMRARAGVDSAATLDVERVREVEAAIGMHLGDDLLAVFAAAVPALRDGHEMTLGMVIGHTGALRDQRARGDLIGIGRSERTVYFCIDKSSPTTAATRMLRYDTLKKHLEPHDLVDWLADKLAQERPGPPPLPGQEPIFELTHFIPESTALGRPVRHVKFGDGRALREMGSGPTAKVQVNFPGRGLKLIQARFLEFLD